MGFLKNAFLFVAIVLIIGGLGSVAWFSNNDSFPEIAVQSPERQPWVNAKDDPIVLPENASTSYLMQLMSMREVNASGTAPDFTLESVGGRPVTLSQYRGRFVLLSFWTTW